MDEKDYYLCYGKKTIQKSLIPKFHSQDVFQSPSHLFIDWLIFLYHAKYLYIGCIVMGSWKSRGNQYLQSVKVLYCKPLINSK